MPEISVIVPVYNVELLLRRCIESILNQRFKDFELILVDDGSIDNSGEICDRYKFTDNRVHVIHKKNGGLASARGVGLWFAKGKYISFCDSDDYINRDFLDVLYNSIKKNKCQCASSLFKKVTNNDTKIINLENICGEYKFNEKNTQCKHIMDLLQNDTGWELCTKLFLKEIIDKNNIVENYLKTCKITGSYAEDMCFYFMYIFCCDSIYYSNYCGYNYCIRSDSIIQKNSMKIRLYEMSEVSYNLFFYVQMYRKSQINDFALVHLFIMNNALIKVGKYNDIPQASKEIMKKKWYNRMTIKSVLRRKDLAKLYGNNKAFNLTNNLFLTIHKSYRLYTLKSVIYYNAHKKRRFNRK